MADTFTFTLYKTPDYYYWERQKWFKQSDIKSVTNPIDSLKYIIQKVIPNIMENDGYTTSEKAVNIFEQLYDSFSIDNELKSESIIIDGIEYSLIIQLNGLQKEYKWNALPLQWKKIEKLSNDIIELNNLIY